MLNIQCPTCHVGYQVQDDFAGKQVKCRCGVSFIAEGPTAVERAASGAMSAVKGVFTRKPRKEPSAEPANKEPASEEPAEKTGKTVWQRFTGEKQDPKLVQQVMDKVQGVLMRNEEVLYVAVQHKVVLNFAPDCFVLTTKRFMIYKPGLLGGVSFDDYVWRELADAKIKEHMMLATITMQTAAGKLLKLDNIPKDQARKVYRIAQEQEEEALLERRRRDREDRQVMVAAPMAAPMPSAATPAEKPAEKSPVERLGELKGLLDAELISQEEFDAKKAEILGSI
ncbi:MAG: PH domain-containing protein [Planctomycetales bacterium]